MESSSATGNPSEVQKFSLSNEINNLNEQQRRAVFHKNGPCLVTAVPGAGKTHSLTIRFLKLLDEGVKPDKIMCCTFTVKAANEMKQRIDSSLNNPFLHTPYIGTMHSLFFAMLKDHPDYAKFRRIAVLTRNYSRLKYIIQIAKDLKDDFKQVDTKTFFGIISRAKNELKTPEELRHELCEKIEEKAYPVGPGCGNVWDYFKRYEELKSKAGVIDYDDMLVKTWEMFNMYPSILEKWQKQFDYIMIDEFQDINTAQWEIIKMLTAPDNNLFVVGDANQSIYSFRGSKPEFLYNIKDDLPSTKIIHMTKNYRCGDKIVDVANAIAKHTEYFMTEIEGLDKRGRVTYNNYGSEESQAQIIVSEIDQLIKSGLNPNEIGIIFRTNACAGMFELKLAVNEIPFRSKAGNGFFSSKIVKDFMAYLEASIRTDCVSSLSRIINVPNRYLGKSFKDDWTNKMNQYGVSPKDALGLDYKQGYWGKNAKELFYHLRFIESLSGDAQKAIKYIREDVGYDEYLLKDSSELDADHDDLLSELAYVADQMGNVGELIGMSDDIKRNANIDEDAVTLTSIHGAKGLEFKHVFFVSLINGIIPHKRSMEDEKAEQEERRMFFVGVTRAEDVLHLSCFTGEGKGAMPSKFLKECRIIS